MGIKIAADAEEFVQEALNVLLTWMKPADAWNELRRQVGLFDADGRAHFVDKDGFDHIWRKPAPERGMCISNENWSWSRAAKTALALSKCNKGVTLYVRQNRMLETWYILDWEPDWNDARWNQFEGMAFLNGERV